MQDSTVSEDMHEIFVLFERLILTQNTDSPQLLSEYPFRDRRLNNVCAIQTILYDEREHSPQGLGATEDERTMQFDRTAAV